MNQVEQQPRIIKEHELYTPTLEWCKDCGNWSFISMTTHTCTPIDPKPVPPWRSQDEQN
jgi:hypothetical protein